MVMPDIFRLARRGVFSPEFRLIGYAHSKMTDDEFRARMRKAAMREVGAEEPDLDDCFTGDCSGIFRHGHSDPGQPPRVNNLLFLLL
jgi:hypothetical protein